MQPIVDAREQSRCLLLPARRLRREPGGEAGASTFVDLLAESVEQITLNGRDVDTGAFDAASEAMASPTNVTRLPDTGPPPLGRPAREDFASAPGVLGQV